MKQEDKEMICEWLDRFVESIEKAKSNSIAHLEQFKKDNNLITEDKLNKWLVNDGFPEFICFTDGNGLFYGINQIGDYFYNKNLRYTTQESDRIATESEVQERLTKLALKLGYGERQSECLSGRHRDEGIRWKNDNVTFRFDSKTNSLLVSGLSNYWLCIFEDGIWAKFIPTEYEKIEAQIKELQAKLNKLKD